MSVADRVPTLVAARILAACRAPAASGQPGRPGRASGSQVRRHPDHPAAVGHRRARGKELDQRDIASAGAACSCPARSIGPLLPGSCANAP